MKTLSYLFLIAFSLLYMAWADDSTSPKHLLNVDRTGLALQGYDPVAFFTEHHPVKGNSAIETTYEGARYDFASEGNRNLFLASPTHYAPQFGGYCAYGVSLGRTAPVTISAYQIVNGKLLMQYDEDIRDRFNQDPTGNLTKATQNWPTLVSTQGK